MRKVRKRDALDGPPLAGDEKEEARGWGVGQGEHGGDGVSAAEIGQVGQMSARVLRNLMDAQAETAPARGKDEQMIARVGREQSGGCVLTRLAQTGAVDAAKVLAPQRPIGA